MAARFDRSSVFGKLVSLTMLLLATASTAFANDGSNRMPPLTATQSATVDSALEAALLRDAADGQWDEHSLFAAAEIASGVSPAQLAAAVERFEALSQELRQAVSDKTTTNERAAFVLLFLHRRLLKAGYDLQATELPRVFAAGRFNCVSATVLFNSLAREAGLDARAVRKPNHTCSVLVDHGKTARVEPTCPDWFDSDRHPVDTTWLPPNATYEAEPLEPISDVALVAMIYYNRGVDALRFKNYQAAMSLNRRALLLDPSNFEARGNLLAAFGRRAMELMAQQDFQSASQIVDEALALDPDHRPLVELRHLIDRAQQPASLSNRRPAEAL